jgi:protein-S-isoprenylcysteine O-methyltransferase Ste14
MHRNSGQATMLAAIRQSPLLRTMSLSRVLDIFERILLAGLFGYMVYSFVHDWLEGGSLSTAILLVSEGAVLVFVLLRRFTDNVSLRPTDWVLALIGSSASLVVQPAHADTPAALTAICSVLMFVGLIVQLSAKLTLRRSFGAVAANRGVKVGGPYRFVRHPMYAGYLMTHIGFLVTNPSAWNALAYGICTIAQVGRILAEEKLLTADDKYRDFAARVRYRLIPGLF